MTYSNPSDTVLDFTMGAGACGVSAKLTGRNFIGIEREEKYYKIAKLRIDNVQENIVTSDHKQLTTQIHKEMKTTPNEKYESDVLIEIRKYRDAGEEIPDNLVIENAPSNTSSHASVQKEKHFNNLFEKRE